jgi:YggT family protein
MTLLIYAVNKFFNILILLIVVRAVMSWFVRNPYDRLGKVYSIIIQLTEPILAPFRNLLVRFNLVRTIDISPILAMFALQIINSIIVNILWRLSF